MANDSTTRFTNRVKDYVKFRPGYPAGIINWLEDNFKLPAGATIVDIGAGTGISSELFLKAGYNVLAVEPNEAMREMSVKLLSGYPGFKAVNGTAEVSGIAAHSVHAIVVGQAFHWFDAPKAKQEFHRILKPGGLLALMWNERLANSPFEREYDQLIAKHAIDYLQVDHRNISSAHIQAFFRPKTCQLMVFSNRQVFDLDGLKGRLLSSSYMPATGDTGYDQMLVAVEELFDSYNEGGKITINYATKLFAGIFS